MYDTSTADTIDPHALRDCCGSFATGVTVVTTRTLDGDYGMTVSAFMSVSLDPPLICVSLSKQSKMLSKINTSRRFAVNILRHGMDRHALHFAGQTDNALTDLFKEQHGLPLLRDAAAVLVADLAQQVEAGDHVLFLGYVRHLERDPSAAPLVYHSGTFGSLDVSGPWYKACHV
ncbi:flavin reductase family protein [Ruegeria sp. SCPT10]|uniref:flavin reductase family protein n=1 Tax=Ruegeria sp. SCP10 TaxID=3141377 RepID=UPI00333AA7A1